MARRMCVRVCTQIVLAVLVAQAVAVVTAVDAHVTGNAATAPASTNVTVFGPRTAPSVKFGVLDCDAEAALGCGRFVHSYNASGWGELYVAGGSHASFSDAAFGAGYAEGVLTQHLIWLALRNYLTQFFGPAAAPSPAVEAWIKKHYGWVRQQAAGKSGTDPYWAAAQTMMSQYDGLAAGYSAMAPAAEALSAAQFMYLQMDGDMETVKDMLGAQGMLGVHPRLAPNRADHSTRPLLSSRCSVLVRVTDDDVFMGHDTWDGYEAMLRVFKHYTLRVPHPKTGVVASTTVSFSGTPGYLSSVDDYYLNSNGLYVTETTNGFFNTSLYADIPGTGTVLSWMRCMIATFTSSSGEEWADTFSQLNSGTYNNQWMVVTLNRFHPGSASAPATLDDGMFWVMEQLPGFVVSADQTAALRTNGYWGSYNIPFYKKVYEISGFEQMFKKNGNAYSHEHCPRANIFRRDGPNVKTLDDYKKVMQHNEWQTDPLQLGSAANGIMARDDLVPNGDAFGGIDSKVTTLSMALKGHTEAMNGPTHLTQTPFSWTEQGGQWEHAIHLGQPIKFDFQYELMRPGPPCVWPAADDA